MRLVILSFYFICVLNHVANGQKILDWSEYFKLLHNADSLYLQGQFSKASEAYSDAFDFNNQRYSSGDRYNAARAWAMAGQIDSAFSNLKKEVTERGFYGLTRLKGESAFQMLHNYKEWKLIVASVRSNQKKEDEKLGKLKPVKLDLEQVLQLDQKYRKQVDSIITNYGIESDQAKALFKNMHNADVKNHKYVCDVIDKYGWQDYNIVGFDAYQAAFLTIQHADSATRIKYLPIIRQAVKDGKAIAPDLALLEDRVLVEQGKKQIYGTQVRCDNTGKIWSVFPIEDEANVDKRRAVLGLEPLAEYLKQWNIVYRPPG